MIRFAALLALGLLAACSSPQTAPDNSVQAQAGPTLLPVVIRTAKGSHRFDVEVAVTPQEQNKGLMFRKELGPASGMLFPMDPPRTASFWMKDTLIPLDMLFIGADGRIINIRERAVPGSTATIESAGPARAVLELNGGTAARLNLKAGDRVRHKEIAN